MKLLLLGKHILMDLWDRTNRLLSGRNKLRGIVDVHCGLGLGLRLLLMILLTLRSGTKQLNSINKMS